MLLWTWECRYLFKMVISFPLDTYPEMGLLDHMWELDRKESWAPKNWCFWTVVLEKTLESPLHCKEIQPVHSEGEADSFEKPLMLGKIEGRRRRGWQRIRLLDGIINSMDMSFIQLQKLVIDREAWRAVVHGVAKSWTWLSWTKLNSFLDSFPLCRSGTE